MKNSNTNYFIEKQQSKFSICGRVKQAPKYLLDHTWLIYYREYVNEIKLSSDGPAPKKPTRIRSQTFITATAALRKLGMANFSTKMARLNAVMEHTNGNTHVATLAKWRDKAFGAHFIQDLIRGPGERKCKTARELIKYLCHGSPAIRAVFQQILDVKALERLNKEQYRHHQKLIVAEGIPCNAWFLSIVLRTALIDGRVMHAGLSNRAKGEIVELFNNPMSSFKVMIMMYEVGAVGLNLQPACDRVLIGSVAKMLAQEAQVAGRVLRVSHLPAQPQKYFCNRAITNTNYLGYIRISGYSCSSEHTQFS